tara:strand:- start:357 stop:458 length:102 start_codon:yes stop_codon:yes gene_type:complete
MNMHADALELPTDDRSTGAASQADWPLAVNELQ